MKSHLLWMCVLFFALISVDSIPNKLRERIQRERDYKVLKKNAGLVRTELPLPPKFCSIKIQGDFFSSREGTDLKFHSIVECGGKTLFEQDATIKTLKPVHLDYGISLFEDTPHGATFVYLKDTDIKIDDVHLQNLVEFPDRPLAAPMVVQDANIEGNDWKFYTNQGGRQAGALLISGNSYVNLTEVDCYANVGDIVGCIRVMNTSLLEVTELTVEANKGRQDGGILAEGKSIFMGQYSGFYNNEAEEESTALHLTSRGTGLLYNCRFYGKRRTDNFYDFLLDPKFDDEEIKSYKLPQATIKADNFSAVDIHRSEFINNTGIYGSVFVKDSAIANIDSSEFVLNAAFKGAGICVNATRGGYVRVRTNTFENNLARYGGGMIPGDMSSSNSSAIDKCTFMNNAALQGGAVWIDYCDQKIPPESVEGRYSFKIEDSLFENNVAKENGGACFVKCGNFDVSNISFTNNTAEESGGAIYGRDIHDFGIWNTQIQFCTSKSGGALFLEGESNAFGTDNAFVRNTADKGGALSCKGDSYINLIENNFTYNTAEKGSTVSVECLCNVDFNVSSFYREENGLNGDFFHINEGCGFVNTSDCKFVVDTNFTIPLAN